MNWFIRDRLGPLVRFGIANFDFTPDAYLRHDDGPQWKHHLGRGLRRLDAFSVIHFPT